MLRRHLLIPTSQLATRCLQRPPTTRLRATSTWSLVPAPFGALARFGAAVRFGERMCSSVAPERCGGAAQCGVRTRAALLERFGAVVRSGAAAHNNQWRVST